MLANMSGSALIGNRRELTRIDKMTQRELWEIEEDFFEAHYERDEEFEEYMRELEADMADQRYDDLWDNRYDELDSHYDWSN
jgi:HEPN domain-containing protein